MWGAGAGDFVSDHSARFGGKMWGTEAEDSLKDQSARSGGDTSVARVVGEPVVDHSTRFVNYV